MKKKNAESMKLNVDSESTEYLKNKIAYHENLITTLNEEKDKLNQELEKTKYQLIRQKTEMEEIINKKDTELRRKNQKIKSFEKDLVNLKNMKNDERKKTREIGRNIDSISSYFHQSHKYVRNTINHFKEVIKQGLVNLG